MKLLQTTAFMLLFSPGFFAAIHYVTPTGSGSMDASSWANAAAGNNLQNVIDNTVDGDEIWVSCGTYFTTTGTDRNISFRMRNYVSIYGSFNGTENDRNDRAFPCGPCSILSAEIGAAGTGDNSYHVISNPSGIGQSAVLDGFVIEGANDDRLPTITEGLGGGIYNDGGYSGNFCNPSIINCLIQNNAAQFGAGIFNSGHSGGTSSPQLTNCIITQNTAYIGGGGIDNFGLGGNASPTLSHCVIYDNSAVQRAGGMYCWAGNNGNASPIVINCVFANNSAVDGGAFVSDNENSPAGSNSGNSNPSLLNCVLWGNTASGVGPQFFIIGTATFQASYSTIDLTGQSGLHILSGSTTGNLSTDPDFVSIGNGLGIDGCWFSADDGLSLKSTSLLRDAGYPSTGIGLDILGNGYFNVADMGAYEFIDVSGLEATQTLEFEVYPNPARTEIKLVFSDKNLHRVEMMRLDGALIREKEFSQNGTIDVSGLEPGMYWIRIDEHRFRKIVVQ